MYDSLVFYNHFGAGDLFESREFVREIMQTVESKNYYYCHSKNSRMFEDMPNLKYNPVDDRMKQSSPFLKKDNMLFINTWIGHNSKYVLPQVGCVLDKNYEMFNDTLTKAGHSRLSRDMYEYLPTVDFSMMNTKGIDKFVKKSKGKRIVLICNGNVNSMQAENFRMDDVIYRLSLIYRDTIFVTTQKLEIDSSNIINFGSMSNSEDGFDLNLIPYLSLSCDTIVGRKSGPFVFAHTKDIWNSTKKSLSFTFAEKSSHFVLDGSRKLRKYWSPLTDVDGVTRKIAEVLDE